ncbi:hypothetical protein P3342_013216 [Pyrenophora teres f. teres]|nr:hypothetical protein P3342_013216 [Pyrenophora teres f. teres]
MMRKICSCNAADMRVPTREALSPSALQPGIIIHLAPGKCKPHLIDQGGPEENGGKNAQQSLHLPLFYAASVKTTQPLQHSRLRSVPEYPSPHGKGFQLLVCTAPERLA